MEQILKKSANRVTKAPSGAVANSVLYTVGNYGGALLSLIASLVARRIVTPLAFGAMSYVQAIYVYPHQVNAIVVNAIGREVPKFDAQGRSLDSDTFINASHTFLFILLLVEFLIYCIVALLQDSVYLRLGFLTIAAVNFFGELGNTYKWILQARCKYGRIALLLLSSSGATALLIIVLSAYWQHLGYFSALMIGSLLQFVIAGLLLAGVVHLRITVRIDWSIAKVAFTAGAPMVLFGIALQGMRTADRFFVQRYLGLESLGYYSLASMVLSVFILLPESLVGSYMPRYLALTASGHLEILRQNSLTLQSTVGSVMTLTIGMVFLVIEPVIGLLLPDYLIIVQPLRILLLGAFFYGSSIVCYYIHLAFSQMRHAISIATVSVGCSLVIYYVVAPYGLSSVALGAVASMVLYSSLLHLSANRIFQVDGMGMRTLIAFGPLILFYGLYFLVSEMLAVVCVTMYAAWVVKKLWTLFPFSLVGFWAGTRAMIATNLMHRIWR